MATATETAPTTPELSLEEKRTALIEAYNEQDAIEQAANSQSDKEGAASASAKKSNKSRQIREVEFEMATEGVTFTPWVKPSNGKKSSRTATVKSEEEVVELLAKAGKVYHGDFAESVKATADQRIAALLKTAEKAGYTVKDPRKAKK